MKNKILLWVKIIGVTQALLCLSMCIPIMMEAFPAAFLGTLSIFTGDNRGDGMGAVIGILAIPVLLLGIIFLFGFISGIYVFKLNSKARKLTFIFMGLYLAVSVLGPFTLRIWWLGKQMLFLVLAINALIIVCAVVSLVLFSTSRVKEQLAIEGVASPVILKEKMIFFLLLFVIIIVPTLLISKDNNFRDKRMQQHQPARGMKN